MDGDDGDSFPSASAPPCGGLARVETGAQHVVVEGGLGWQDLDKVEEQQRDEVKKGLKLSVASQNQGQNKNKNEDQGKTTGTGGTRTTPEQPVCQEKEKQQEAETANVIPAEVSNLGPLDRPYSTPTFATASTTPTTFAQTTPMPTTGSRPAEVQLHSPSTEIIGTPFATDSFRFEYPFPPATFPGSSSEFGSSVLSTNRLSPSSGIPSLTQPLSVSSSPPSIQPYSSPTVIAAAAAGRGTSPPTGFISPEKPAVHHPKLKVTVAPIPPGVAKKRHRWSLSLRTRKNSGTANAELVLNSEASTARTPPESAPEPSYHHSPTLTSPSPSPSPSPSSSRKDSLIHRLTGRSNKGVVRPSHSVPPNGVPST